MKLIVGGRDRVCGHCGIYFLCHRPSDLGRFCSYRCMGLAKVTLPDPVAKPCVVCGTTFTPRRKYPQQRFCSPSCQWKAQKGPAYNARIARESAEKRGDDTRGVGHQKWPYRKNMGTHEHRVAAEAALGRPLKPGEIVRFLSDDRSNTSPDNLAVIPDRSTFARELFTGRRQSQAQVEKRVASRAQTLRAQKGSQ